MLVKKTQYLVKELQQSDATTNLQPKLYKGNFPYNSVETKISKRTSPCLFAKFSLWAGICFFPFSTFIFVEKTNTRLKILLKYILKLI